MLQEFARRCIRWVVTSKYCFKTTRAETVIYRDSSGLAPEAL